MTALIDWTLEDRYGRDEGRLFLTGTQALVKLPMLQRALDRRAGLATSGFISGYRGSPLGNYDAALWAAKEALAERDVVFHPGLNEDLAATSVWGSQQATMIAGVAPHRDGVFAIWYGKGPGVDRTGDVFKHGNLYGAAPHGGVLVLAGDDHGGKSSTLSHQSDQVFSAAAIPVLHPTGVGDYLKLGLFGWAMSRATGLWAGFKCVTEQVESTATIDFSFDDATFVVPDGLIEPRFRLPQPGLNVLAEEDALLNRRLPAALAFARANRIDGPVITPPSPRLGIVTVGKAHGDTMQALADLGLDAAASARLGLGVYAVRMAWPLETQGIAAFAHGYDELLIVEEKRPFVEPQVKDALYSQPAGRRPAISGKVDVDGRPLLPISGELSPALIRSAIVARLQGHGAIDDALAARINAIEARERAAVTQQAPVTARTPAFCSGCPHNTSTRIPEGSLAFGGIGCHTMAMFLPDRPTLKPTQMGGEGANWIGMAPFVDRKHIFQNLGDGTYFHSGLLAVRAAIAAGVNITYKVLYNDAVAMTGGQPIDGQQTVGTIAAQLRAEGVATIRIVTDDVTRSDARGPLPTGVTVHDRKELLMIESELATLPGITAIIYDQTCAAEKRRRRKRASFPDPAKRYFINPAVCEGCGDCGAKSNCVSLHPEPTVFGVKRRIDQSSCNKDYSCVEGFCPSFVTIMGGDVRKAKPVVVENGAPLPEPVLPTIDGSFDILVTGIGGTGVVTIGAVIGTAAHLAGKAASLLDLTGLAQKNGAVMSHIRIAETPAALGTTRIGLGAADVLIGCDLLVSAAPDVVKSMSATTRVVLNTHLVPVAAFQQNRDLDLGGDSALGVLARTTGYAGDGFDATARAEAEFGNAILANMMMLGVAWQKGLIPLPLAAIERAITLNGVSVKSNLAAFAAGRRSVADPGQVRLAAAVVRLPETLDEVVAVQAGRLRAYQNAAYADPYLTFVADVAVREDAVVAGSTALAIAVARNLGKLMAYKDEYEVARLHRDPALATAITAQFDGNVKLRFNLAPPLFARRDPHTGHLRKREFGTWMLTAFGILAPMKRLRGTVFDPFGYSPERRQERALIDDYRATIGKLLPRLDAATLPAIVAIATLPDRIRGFGHVKEAAMKTYAADLQAALHALDAAAPPATTRQMETIE